MQKSFFSTSCPAIRRGFSFTPLIVLALDKSSALRYNFLCIYIVAQSKTHLFMSFMIALYY